MIRAILLMLASCEIEPQQWWRGEFLSVQLWMTSDRSGLVKSNNQIVKLTKSAPCWAERVSSKQLLLASHFPNCSNSPQVQRWGDSHWGLNSFSFPPRFYIENHQKNRSSRIKLDSTQEVWGRLLLPQWSSWPRGEEGRGLPTRWK